MEPPICAVAEPVKGVEKGSPREAGPGELHGKTVYFTALCPAWQIFSEKRLFLSVFPPAPPGSPPGRFTRFRFSGGKNGRFVPFFPWRNFWQKSANFGGRLRPIFCDLIIRYILDQK